MQRSIVTLVLVVGLTGVSWVTAETTPQAIATPGTAAAPTDQPVIAAGEPCVLGNGETINSELIIPKGTTCEVDGLLKSKANIIVKGKLVMRSGDTIKFINVDESKFVGGGDGPVASDVGLWVVESGVLSAIGTKKTAWSYKWEAGWKQSDKIVAAPHRKNKFFGFKDVNAKADVPSANKFGYKTELLNLTRDVKIQGTKKGYAHVFIKSTKRSTLKWVELRYLGVQVGGNDASGRYAIHLHKNQKASDGMFINGVVARDIGNHAFVPHASDGITFKNTIAYKTVEEAYWWDPKPAGLPSGAKDPNATNDLKITCAIAAKVDTDGEGRGSAFYLGSSGKNVTITKSVAVGTWSSGGNSFDISAYQWPGTGRTNWKFNNNIAHNNYGHGIFVWQNTGARHVVTNYDAYYNGKFAISHGAYRNPYKYQGLELWGNGDGAIELHANAKKTKKGATQLWRGIKGNGKWIVMTHNLTPISFVKLFNVKLPSFVLDEGNNEPGKFWLAANVDFDNVNDANKHPDTLVVGPGAAPNGL